MGSGLRLGGGGGGGVVVLHRVATGGTEGEENGREKDIEREKGCHHWLCIQCLWKVIEGKHKFRPVYKEIDFLVRQNDQM
jgi:hypothetical protein